MSIKINRKNSATIQEAFNSFIKRQKVKNLRESTIIQYETILTHFIDWLGGDQPVSTLAATAIDEYILLCKEKGNTPVTINMKLRHIRAFIYFVQEAYETKPFKVHLLKVDEDNKEPYTNEELRRLLKKPEGSSFVEWRSWAFINFFLGTGCRISTALDVKVRDIDFENRTIFLSHLKNRRQQYLPLSASLADALRYYMQLWDATPEDYLFPNEINRNKLKRGTAASSISEYNLRRGVIKTGVHRFRHTFAKNYIINGGGALQLQQILGHSSLEITKKYVKLYATDLQANFSQFCLLDNLQK